MESIKEYIFLLIQTTLATGIINLLCPSNEKSTLSKYVKYITSICLILVLVSPLKFLPKAISTLSSYSYSISENPLSNQYFVISNQLILDTSKENIEKSIANLLIQKYKLKEGQFKISLEIDSSDYSNLLIKQVTLFLYDWKIWYLGNEAEQYLEQVLSCPIEIQTVDLNSSS